ncbi:MAG: 2OG-Fe(II) oxygenase [Rhodanobacteraceae bacterium]|nr:2OG-Fe(II) oxygenase [Rhodanobacteraceae bacterium]
MATALQEGGWCLATDFLPAPTIAALAADCRARDEAGELADATTGRSRLRTTTALRGDRTRWFDEAALSAAQTAYWSAMHTLRLTLNRRLLLGLETLEAHYALYPPGAGYARHRDRFRDHDARVLSSVLYLNHDWSSDAGGQLRLHLPESKQDITPTGGTLVLFLSAEIEHEVLPAHRERLSIAGWFRRRELD